MENQLFTVENLSDVKKLIELGYQVKNVYLWKGMLRFQFEKTEELVNDYFSIKNKRKAMYK